MSTIQFTSYKTDDQEFLTVFANGQLLPPVDSTHPNFSAIKEIIADSLQCELDQSEVDHLVSLFDVAKTIAERFKSVSDRIKVGHGRILLDGEEVENALTKQILRFMDEGVEDWKPLVNFFEKVLSNPQEHSREQLYSWLDKHEFTITADGDIVGYKGVTTNGDGEFCSISSGSEQVLVDGEPHTGRIPNPIGAEIEMARSLVHHDPTVGCSRGLHVGTYEYASSFSRGTVLEVHVNPRDVVSVPTDCNWQKVRTCRYTVVDVIESKYGTPCIGLDADNSTDDDVAKATDLVLDNGTPVRVGDVWEGGLLPEQATVTDVKNKIITLDFEDGSSGDFGVDILCNSDLVRRAGKHPAQDDQGRFSNGRPGSKRDSSGRFV